MPKKFITYKNFIKEKIIKLKGFIQRKNYSKRKIIILSIISILIIIGVIFLWNNLSYDLTISKYGSYINGGTTTQNISVESLNNKNIKSIYNDLKDQGYNSFLYGFDLVNTNDSKVSGEDVDVTLKLSSDSALENKIVNIYVYNEKSNTFECLGEVRASDSDIVFKTKTTGEHFITLANAPTYDISNESIETNEEFNNAENIGNDWTYEIGNNDGWGNDELEYYTNSTQNSNIENGSLNITARKQSYGGKEYTSARLVSKETYLYGKFEICAKLPKGDGMWPAIWLLAANDVYGNWPDSGEIDIMESVGKDPGYIRGSLQMSAYNFKTDDQKTEAIKVSNLYSQYHVYGLLWTPNKIELSVDGHVYFTYYRDVYNIGADSWKSWPFNKAFNMILNVAVGGSYGGEVDNSIFPQTMSIKYIKVYNLGLKNYELNKVN
ncbi:MAG: glycoside hydrolase family 16 protein [Clostridium perfringens]|nr:glycoside hydrolase family 16 protein [Clostridium perfringens]